MIQKRTENGHKLRIRVLMSHSKKGTGTMAFSFIYVHIEIRKILTRNTQIHRYPKILT